MSRRTIVASVSKKNPGDEHRDFWVDELANQMKSGSLRFRQRRHSRLCQPSLANFSPHDMHLRSVGRSWAARWSMTSSSASDELEFDSLIYGLPLCVVSCRSFVQIVTNPRRLLTACWRTCALWRRASVISVGFFVLSSERPNGRADLFSIVVLLYLISAKFRVEKQAPTENSPSCRSPIIPGVSTVGKISRLSQFAVMNPYFFWILTNYGFTRRTCRPVFRQQVAFRRRGSVNPV